MCLWWVLVGNGSSFVELCDSHDIAAWISSFMMGDTKFYSIGVFQLDDDMAEDEEEDIIGICIDMCEWLQVN